MSPCLSFRPSRSYSTHYFQSIYVIENPQLRAIFLMLREELKDEDIPHRTTVRNRILQIWDEHLEQLSSEMQVRAHFLLKAIPHCPTLQESLGKVSFTMDLWTDPNLSPFMAVTAHWIEASTQQTLHGPQHTLKLRADLIGFQRVPGRHDGEHLAHAFLHVTDRISITWKVCNYPYLNL